MGLLSTQQETIKLLNIKSDQTGQSWYIKIKKYLKHHWISVKIFYHLRLREEKIFYDKRKKQMEVLPIHPEMLSIFGVLIYISARLILFYATFQVSEAHKQTQRENGQQSASQQGRVTQQEEQMSRCKHNLGCKLLL